MSHQQRVLNMLAKLSQNTQQARKVQFSLSDNASDAINEIKLLETEINEYSLKIDEAIEMARQAYNGIGALQRALQVSYDIAVRVKGEIEEAADNLGIDPSIIQNYNEISDAVSNAEIIAEDLTAYSQDDIFSGF
jgi:hypothetical protein